MIRLVASCSPRSSWSPRPAPACSTRWRQRLTRGSRASIAAAFGCTLGIVPHMIAAMLGLAAVLHTSALAFAALKWCGVAYLLYMSWQALRETGALAVDGEIKERSKRPRHPDRLPDQHPQPRSSRSSSSAFLPQFIAADEAHVLARMLELSGAFMAMTLAVFVVYGLCAASVRERVISRPRVMAWLRRCFAAGFAAAGRQAGVCGAISLLRLSPPAFFTSPRLRGGRIPSQMGCG